MVGFCGDFCVLIVVIVNSGVVAATIYFVFPL